MIPKNTRYTKKVATDCDKQQPESFTGSDDKYHLRTCSLILTVEVRDLLLPFLIIYCFSNKVMPLSYISAVAADRITAPRRPFTQSNNTMMPFRWLLFG